MYIYIYIYLYSYIHICIYAYIYMHIIFIYMYIYVYVYVYVCIQAYRTRHTRESTYFESALRRNTMWRRGYHIGGDITYVRGLGGLRTHHHTISLCICIYRCVCVCVCIYIYTYIYIYIVLRMRCRMRILLRRGYLEWFGAGTSAYCLSGAHRWAQPDMYVCIRYVRMHTLRIDELSQA
jgi:hypothetical protein